MNNQSAPSEPALCSCPEGPVLGSRRYWAKPRCSRCHLFTWDENVCGRCYGPNPTWSADSPLWNYVMRGDNPNNAEPFDGIICPICFTQLSELAGVRDGRNAIWRLTPDYAYITVELTMTRRSDGAVWNYDTNLWR